MVFVVVNVVGVVDVPIAVVLFFVCWLVGFVVVVSK